MIELPKSCGINLNLNNLGGELTTQISGYLNLDLGTPAGLASLKGTLESGLNTLKGKLTDLIPIPDLPNISLRDELATLASLPLASTAAAAKIVELAGSFVGITNIAGFANLNLTDLAKSVFSLSGTFDPCALLNGAKLPNIMKDPVSGLLKKLPLDPPDLGSTLDVLPNTKELQKITDNLQEAVKDNLPIVSTQAQSLLDNNIANMIPKIPEGLDNVIPGGFTNSLGGALPKSALQDSLGGLGGVLSGAVSNLTSQATSTASGLAGGLSSVTAAAPGLLQELASETPALLNELQAQAPDAIAKVSKEVTGARNALGSNVQTAIGGMGNTIRKLPSGQEVVETFGSFLNDFKSTKAPKLVEVPLKLNGVVRGTALTPEIDDAVKNFNATEVRQYLKLAPLTSLEQLAVRQYHAETLRLDDNRQIEEFRATHPEFDDPTSPDFHRFAGNKVKEVPNHWNGKPNWRNDIPGAL